MYSFNFLTMGLKSATTLMHTYPPRWYRAVLTVARYIVLALSVGMIVWITRDTIDGVSLLSSPGYMRYQFGVCLFFLFDIVLETFGVPRGERWRWLRDHLLFILVSVPWLSLFGWWHLELSPTVAYLVKFIPMIRTGYVVALVTGALTANKAVSLLAVYVMWTAASVYFGSLMFFVEESPVNPQVDSWPTAMWWASVSMTTLGSSINAVTATGRVLGVILSGEGLMLLPVFTVYVTNAVQTRERQGALALDSFRRGKMAPVPGKNNGKEEKNNENP